MKLYPPKGLVNATHDGRRVDPEEGIEVEIDAVEALLSEGWRDELPQEGPDELFVGSVPEIAPRQRSVLAPKSVPPPRGSVPPKGLPPKERS